MAGGTFSGYNKVRPGAYLNFVAAAKSSLSVGERGVVTIPLALSWGEQGEIISVTGEDLLSGKSYAKIGMTFSDPEAQVLREALKNAHTVLTGRVDKGGSKASAEVCEDITATALYNGVFGNRLTVAVNAIRSNFEIVTALDGRAVDIQSVGVLEDFTEKGWIALSGSGELAVNAGIPLTGGVDGTVSDADYSDYMGKVKGYKWNVMALTVESQTLQELVKSFIKEMRERTGRKVQAVLYDFDGDYEGIINSICGYKTPYETVSPLCFTAYVAGATAGANVNKSNTYHVVANAKSIIDEITDHAEIETALKTGKLILSHRSDGAVIIEKDINSLTSIGGDKSYDFTKNRVIRTLDDIANQISSVFEMKYIGKVDNTPTGRSVFKAEIISFLNQLQSMNAISDFDGPNDVTVSEGPDIESIVVGLSIKAADAMEKAYITVTVR